ncbi:MAG: TfoX/Sxy family protein [Pseudomonadales bacterium]|nr:TfoX/Sxy family protein [Pseudomonadales bacterium]
MAFDHDLAARVREGLHEVAGTLPDEKRMFGGLCFLLAGNMCCGILGDRLIARVGPAAYPALLNQPGAGEMDFTGRPMKGMIMVDADVVADDAVLRQWLKRCLDFVLTLPPK